MLGPYRTPNVEATLDTLYASYGVLYRVVKQEDAPADMVDIWVEPDTRDRTPEE